MTKRHGAAAVKTETPAAAARSATAQI